MSANPKHNFNHFLYKSKVSISIKASNICGYNTTSKHSCTTELTLFLLGKMGLFRVSPSKHQISFPLVRVKLSKK